MIQRIQTLYFFLAIVVLIAFYFCPILFVEHAESGISSALSIVDRDSINDSFSIRTLWGNMDDLFSQNFSALAIANSFLPMALLILIIVKFNNRKYQLRWSKIVMVILVILCALTLSYLFFVNTGEAVQKNYLRSFGSYLPILALIFTFLGYKGVKRDDDLIKSADRIR